MSTTLRIYAHVMATEPGERKRLRALVEGTDWAPMGTSAEISELSSLPTALRAKKKP
ncbi:MAG TPA: hypothetical protein VF781_07565 [Solirubrobacteraceae bacterium]